MPDLTRPPAYEVEKSIHALLVDDNKQWATFVASELERRDSDLEVTVAFSATEALLTIREAGSIDCVVTDYRMPEIGGIELLERVREERAQLPFILITGEGSEDVASQAIAAGISDYVAKDPRTDQTSLLATKIRSAVAQYRLRQVVEESEAQYRTVTEQSRDAIAVLQDFQVVFCNSRLEEFVGTTREELGQASFEWDMVHPDDREHCRSIITRWHEGVIDDDYHKIRFIDVNGDLRYCEFTGQGIRHGNEPAILVTIRDVTRRIQHERTMAREREVNAAIQKLLITERTRSGFERAVVRRLHDDGYALVWIGEEHAGDIRPRAAAGDTPYLDDVSFTTADHGHTGEPVVWATRSGDPQFAEGFGELFETSWCAAATERGLQAGAGLPLRHHDVSMGVLGVYADAPDAFNEAERRLLSGLAETVAFAIYNFERERSLAADHTTEAVLRFDANGHRIASLLSSTGGNVGNAELTVHGTLAQEDGRFIQYLTAAGVALDRLVAVATDDERIESLDIIAKEPELRFQLVTAAELPEAALAKAGAVVRKTTVTANAADVRIELAPTRDLRTVTEALAERFGRVTVESVRNRERTAPDVTPRYVDIGKLTDKQANVLQAAYHQGYFEQPRLQSAQEIAASLDIAHSTYLQHLRTAQRKVFMSLFEGDSVGDG